MLRRSSTAILVLAVFLGLARGAAAQSVLLLHADPEGALDVAAKLSDAGAFTQIDLLQVGGPGSPVTPTLATLAQYQAVMVWSNYGFANPVGLGNVLADYVDDGGGVVQATFAFCASTCFANPPGPAPAPGLGLDGRWQTGGYLPFSESAQYLRRTGGPAFMLVKNPSFVGHPIFDGVGTVDGGTSAWHNASVPLPGTSLLGAWSPTGRPFVGTRSGPIAGRIAGLNMYPTSADAVTGGWNPATDGARLLANALLFVMASPPFSHAPAVTPAGACVCTPLLMNTDADGLQHFWVRAQGGPLTITAVAHAVNSWDRETVAAEVYDPNGNRVLTLTTGYEAGQAPGFESSATGVVPGAAPGAIYRVTVTTPDTPDAQSHYRLEFEGADSAATSSPSSSSFTPQPVTWFLNVAAGESLDVRVSVDGTPASTTVLNYTLFDPMGIATTGSVTPSTGSDAIISVPGAAAGTWALRVDAATGYYRLDKTTGFDQGLYLTSDVMTPGQMHGAGFIRDGGDRYEFTFQVRERAAAGERGSFHLRVSDGDARGRQRRGDELIARTVDFVAFSDSPAHEPGGKANADTVLFSGAGRWNGADGYRYEVYAEDRGEPGRDRDSMRITVRDPNGAVVAFVSGEIDGGSVQSTRVRH